MRGHQGSILIGPEGGDTRSNPRSVPEDSNVPHTPSLSGRHERPVSER
jgi:hypothetical protein